MSQRLDGRRVEFLQVLGRGGFGAVYLADIHGRDGFVQRVAIKVLSEALAHADEMAARQRDEARLLSLLNHDHIVKVYDLTELHGRPAVVMEYVEGVDLSALQRKGPLPTKVALQAIAATASALDAAWSASDPRTGKPLRVIHRDIKPSNLLLSLHGGLKVLDFGIARGDFDREGFTGSALFGTGRFMAPEQWLHRRVSDRVDVFALGITLVEIMAGATLERAPLDPARFDAHMTAAADHALPDDLGPPHRQTVRQLMLDMLSFDPTRRPSAAAVHERVQAIVDHLPGESIGPFARRMVPPLVGARAAKHERDPLLSTASLHTPADAVADPGGTRPDLAPRPPGDTLDDFSLFTPTPASLDATPLPTSPPLPPQPLNATTPPPVAAPPSATAEVPSQPTPETAPWPGSTTAASDAATASGAAVPPQAVQERSFTALVGIAATTGALLGLLLLAVWKVILPDPSPPGVEDTVAVGEDEDHEGAVDPGPDAETTSPAESDPANPDEDAVADAAPDEPSPAAQPQEAAPERARKPRAAEPTPTKRTARQATPDPPERSPEPVEPAAEPTPTAEPAPVPEPEPEPEPEAVPKHPVRLTSTPIGARVSVDGAALPGRTPLDTRLPRGRHQVEIRQGDVACVGPVSVGPLSARTYRCNLTTRTLEAVR